MARAIRKAAKRSQSPFEAVAKRAEALAKSRFKLQINGLEFVTEVDGDLSIDVAKMYKMLLAN